MWLIVIVSAYFIFAINSLIDNYLLAGPPNPKSYSFYVGLLGVLVLILAPFVGFSIPEESQILLNLSAGALYIIALFWLYTGLEYFEPSRVIPAIGGILPIFTFGLVYFLSGGKAMFGEKEIFAFLFLIVGSVLISLEREKKISFKSFKISAISAFFFTLAFVLSKYVYLQQPFWSGFIWMRIGGALCALCFLLSKEIRKEIFGRRFTLQKKSAPLFLLNQGAGAGAFILQNFAISLAGLVYLPFINALQGTQYVFLFLLALILSRRFPKLSEEKLTRKNLAQKVISIILIGLGLVILSF
jgi:drug/metabolite transporter (DMT)-like permease